MGKYDGSAEFVDEFEWALAVDAVNNFLSTRPTTREAMEEIHQRANEAKHGTPEADAIERTVERVGDRVATLSEDHASTYDFRYMVAATMMGFDF